MPTAATAGAGSKSYDFSKPGVWAQAVLDGLGAPSDPNTPQGLANIGFLEAWRKAEGTAASYNPLATTLPLGDSTDFNSIGVQNYATPQDGVNATVKTLLAGYPHVLGMLRVGGPGAIADNTGVWADLNRWVSGKSTPTDSAYVQSIARGFFHEGGAADWTSFDLGDAGNAAKSAAKKVADATGVTALAKIASSIASFVGALLDINTWRRVGLALLGLTLMLSGGYILARGAGVAPTVG